MCDHVESLIAYSLFHQHIKSMKIPQLISKKVSKKLFTIGTNIAYNETSTILDSNTQLKEMANSKIYFNKTHDLYTTYYN